MTEEAKKIKWDNNEYCTVCGWDNDTETGLCTNPKCFRSVEPGVPFIPPSE